MDSELLVREALAVLGLGDLDTFRSFLHAEASLVVHAHDPFPFGGEFCGPEQALSALQASEDFFQLSGILWSNLVHQDNKVALYGQHSCRVRSSGLSDTSGFALVFELAAGLVQRIEYFLDTAMLQRLAEGRPGLRPVARGALSSAAALGMMAASAQSVESESVEQPELLLKYYGPEAPPRSITLPELATENIEWASSGLGVLPTAGPFYGRSAFERHISASRQLFGAYQMVARGSVASGDTLAVFGDMLVEPTSGRSGCSLAFFHALTVEGGCIRKGLEVLDSQTLLGCLQDTAERP